MDKIKCECCEELEECSYTNGLYLCRWCAEHKDEVIESLAASRYSIEKDYRWLLDAVRDCSQWVKDDVAKHYMLRCLAILDMPSGVSKALAKMKDVYNAQ